MNFIKSCFASIKTVKLFVGIGHMGQMVMISDI